MSIYHFKLHFNQNSALCGKPKSVNNWGEFDTGFFYSQKAEWITVSYFMPFYAAPIVSSDFKMGGMRYQKCFSGEVRNICFYNTLDSPQFHLSLEISLPLVISGTCLARSWMMDRERQVYILFIILLQEPSHSMGLTSPTYSHRMGHGAE